MLLRPFERRTTTALEEVSLQVGKGEVFGLLGPNGAGKTTLLKVVSTLILPSSGSAHVNGLDVSRRPRAVRDMIGYVVSEERSFYWRLSGKRNLEFFAAMHGLYGREADGRIDEVLSLVDMTVEADKPFSNYSTGMKQRLAIARSLLHKPKLLFLDEPSRSLDPKATARLHNLIVELNREQNTTVFLITHDLAEAESLCQRVGVMHEGRIQVVGEPSMLRRQLRPQQHYSLKIGRLSSADTEALIGSFEPVEIEPDGEHHVLRFKSGDEDGILSALLDTLRGREITILSIEGHPPTLEEVFEHFTSDQMTEEESNPRSSEPVRRKDEERK